MSTPTTNLAMEKPAVNSPVDEDQWGDQLNANLDILDSEAVLATVDKNWADKISTRPVFKDYGETLNAAGNITGATTADITSGNHYSGSLTGNVTFTFSNPSASGTVCILVLYLKQAGSGSYTVTWPASVDWGTTGAPTLSTAVGETDELAFITRDAGTNWSGSVRTQGLTV